MKHYKRNLKHGDPNVVARLYRHENPICRISECSRPTLAKGLCTNHYALQRRNGAPTTVKEFRGEYVKDGYVYVMTGRRHYEPLHRLIMSAALGRQLLTEEHVHHIDGDTLNNSLENLEILSAAEHARVHGLGRHINLRGR